MEIPEPLNPWKRRLLSDAGVSDKVHYFGAIPKQPKYVFSSKTTELDINTKRAALRIAPSVVGVLTYSGEVFLCEGCGTIIEVDSDNNTMVVTSANLVRRPTSKYIAENNLANDVKVRIIVAEGKSYNGEIVSYDFHYNLLILRFQSSLALPAARLAHINDSLSLSATQERPFGLRPHSVNIAPGDSVVAFGRYCGSPFDIVATPGIFSLDRCELDCKELCLTSCIINKCMEGGPLINLSGEVIGIIYYDLCSATPFLPINVVHKWWEHYKRHGKCCHPSLGFEATNLYGADLPIIERVLKRFPNISKGVIVEKVTRGSSAHSSGLLKDDIIVQCGDKEVESFLELLEMLWGKVGDSVEMVVARANQDMLVNLNLTVAEEKLNRWPCWYQYKLNHG